MISVHPWTPWRIRIWAAFPFNSAIRSVPRRVACSEASPAFMAVARIPVPMGLVRIRLSPGCAPEFSQIRDGCATPVTESPYFSSRSSMLCPPARAAPASWTFSMPPARIARRTLLSIVVMGKQAIFMAVMGRPPMAYTSLRAFAAAMRPKS